MVFVLTPGLWPICTVAVLEVRPSGVWMRPSSSNSCLKAFWFTVAVISISPVSPVGRLTNSQVSRVVPSSYGATLMGRGLALSYVRPAGSQSVTTTSALLPVRLAAVMENFTSSPSLRPCVFEVTVLRVTGLLTVLVETHASLE